MDMYISVLPTIKLPHAPVCWHKYFHKFPYKTNKNNLLKDTAIKNYVKQD